jgi:hypothetical protein
MLNVIPLENEPEPMKWVGEERTLECSGLFDGYKIVVLFESRDMHKRWT